MSCREPPPQNSIQIHSLLALQTEEDICEGPAASRLKEMNQKTGVLPYVAAVIRHYVGMLAALHDDNLLLDDGKIILCGGRQRQSKHVYY